MLPHLSGDYRVVRDARAGTTDDGTNWAQARIMASRSTKDERGQWITRERLFLTIKARPHQIEDVAGLRQGDEVFVSGEPFTDEYVGRDGQRRSDLVMYPRQIRLVKARTAQGSTGTGHPPGAPENGAGDDYGVEPWA